MATERALVCQATNGKALHYTSRQKEYFSIKLGSSSDYTARTNCLRSQILSGLLKGQQIVSHSPGSYSIFTTMDIEEYLRDFLLHVPKYSF